MIIMQNDGECLFFYKTKMVSSNKENAAASLSFE